MQDSNSIEAGQPDYSASAQDTAKRGRGCEETGTYVVLQRAIQ